MNLRFLQQRGALASPIGLGARASWSGRLISTRPGRVLALLSVVGLVLLPQLGIGDFWTSILTKMLIFALFAMSLDLLLGYAGLPSLGHAAFFGMGAYTVAILYRGGWRTAGDGVVDNFWLALPLGILVAGITAALFGLLALRTRSAYFIIITLALAQVIFAIAFGWQQLTNADDGLTVRLQGEWLLPRSGGSDVALYYVVLGFFLVSTALMYLIVRSPFGHVLVGIRESESRMRVLGYNVWLYKYAIFIIAGMFAGLAGGFIVYYQDYVNPAVVSIGPSAEAFLAVIMGSPGTLFGPAVGGAAIVFLENFISDYTERWTLILGIIFVMVVLFVPRGFYRTLQSPWLIRLIRQTFAARAATVRARSATDEADT